MPNFSLFSAINTAFSFPGHLSANKESWFGPYFNIGLIIKQDEIILILWRKKYMVDRIGQVSGNKALISQAKPTPGSLHTHLANIIRKEKLYDVSDFETAQSRAVCFGSNFYLIREHHTALVHWARVLKEGKIGYNSLLLHADLHPDLGRSVAAVDKEILGQDGFPLNRDRLYYEAERMTKMNDSYPDLTPEENFIRLGIDLKIVGEYVHLIPGQEDGFMTDELPVPARTVTLDTFMNTFPPDPSRSVIFDLDLDFFSDLKDMPYKRVDNWRTELQKMISIIKKFAPGVITIAFSLRSTSMVKTYLTLPQEECVEIVVQLLTGLGLQSGGETYFDEPRRTMRFSPR